MEGNDRNLLASSRMMCFDVSASELGCPFERCPALSCTATIYDPGGEPPGGKFITTRICSNSHVIQAIKSKISSRNSTLD